MLRAHGLDCRLIIGAREITAILAPALIIAIVSYTSDMPQRDVGTYSGLYNLAV